MSADIKVFKTTETFYSKADRTRRRWVLRSDKYYSRYQVKNIVDKPGYTSDTFLLEYEIWTHSPSS
mgnify:CR=1 FL=1